MPGYVALRETNSENEAGSCAVGREAAKKCAVHLNCPCLPPPPPPPANLQSGVL